MYRLGVFTFLLVAVVPLLQSTSFFGHASVLQPVSGSAIPRRDIVQTLDRRADSPTNVCFRWAQQSALVNGTLYLYGGQATTEPGQDTDAWNNNFLSLDLTKTWQIATPALTGRPQPSGPPNVSLGYLWSSHDSLFLYGGQFSWKPPVPPTAYSTWEYAIADDEWIEHSDPVTSKGASSPSDGEPVQRAAEGAGANVPSLGRGFYFGGHLDGYTTEGWSQSVPRKYLQSLLEFTFPGAKNSHVEVLSSDREAGNNGVYRNVTEGGQQAQVGFTQRADGLLIYVPGFGNEGILLAVAGGTNETFTQMNNIDVYDIATSSWYIQSTSGTSPTIRVNPCAVIAAAPDGTSYNIYMYGGQNLIPAGNQTQFDDMWILTLPSFTWIKVDTDGQSVPPGRSGHTCNVWDSQMVMVGGYTGEGTLTCETPGIYVFDLSALEWVNQFTATSSGSDDDTRTTTNKQSNGDDSTGESNPFNQQPAQRYSADSAGGLEGSYGYKVPQAVIDVVGGNENGGATLTTPVNTATAGPLATGKPITYTNADGSTSTSTPGSSNGSSGGGGGANIGAIVAGVIAGVLFIVACYLAFCAYVYRKQLQLYKRHVEMSQAQARGEKLPAIPGLLATDASSNGKATPSDPSRFGGSMAKWPTNSDGRPSGSHHSRHESGGSSHATPVTGGYNAIRRNSDVSDGDEDLLGGHEPTFVGVMLNPRRSLRVINRD
ncbi:putative galactose oxidase/kelch, beta-propeller, kelch-type beta propeller [Septoria linicola]|nr:putative galactose oxidase/kelch, beta-propeller, kelch-type beta propeller [Septoria linicola]